MDSKCKGTQRYGLESTCVILVVSENKQDTMEVGDGEYSLCQLMTMWKVDYVHDPLSEITGTLK